MEKGRGRAKRKITRRREKMRKKGKRRGEELVLHSAFLLFATNRQQLGRIG